MAGTEHAPPPPAAMYEPDPRVERSRRLILSAALEVLSEEGYGGLTIEGVAARAGVGKSTIYRHWPGKLQLVEGAVATLRSGIPLPAEGPVRERLTALLQQVAAGMAGSTWSRCLPAIIDAAERDPGVLALHRRFSCERRQVLLALLAEGVAAGEISPAFDLDLVAECLIGPIMVRRLLLHEPFDPETVPLLVSQVLGPSRARPPGR